MSGIDDWADAIPRRLVPKFAIPKYHLQGERDLILWTSVAYHLAYRFERPYFSAVTEWGGFGNTYTDWRELARPDWLDPRRLLIHEADAVEGAKRWRHEILNDNEGRYVWPGTLATYPRGYEIIGDFLEFSIAACDVLVHMAEDIHQEQTPPRKPYVRKKTPTKKRRSKKTLTDVLWLSVCLYEYHYSAIDSTDPLKPLELSEIADRMSWHTSSGEPDVNRASRRLGMLYGENPSTKYKNLFIDQKRAAKRRHGNTEQDERMRMQEFLDDIDPEVREEANIDASILDKLDGVMKHTRQLHDRT